MELPVRCGLTLLLALCAQIVHPVGGQYSKQFAQPRGGADKHGKCQPIIPNDFCSKLGYNMTLMPNSMGHYDQRDALQSLQEFEPLIRIGCSNLLQFFLCSIYFPMCTTSGFEDSLVLGPCRSMCLKVNQGCEPTLLSFLAHSALPEPLKCDKLPESGLCMSAPNGSAPPVKRLPPSDLGIGDSSIVAIWRKMSDLISQTTTTRAPATQPQCPSKKFLYVETLPTWQSRYNHTCHLRCDVDFMFAQSDKHLLQVWLTVWAAVGLFCSALTVGTYLLDTGRFQYPERPIIFLSLCCGLYAAGYLLGILAGAERVACERAPGAEEVQIMNSGGLGNPWCVTVFLVLYYFGMSAGVWWVVLTLAWFLASARKWSPEAIDGLSSYFHLAAWALPAVQAIVALTMHNVEADEATGFCLLTSSSESRQPLLIFVVGPLATYLVVGAVLTSMGFISMFRIRRNLRLDSHDGADIRKLEKLMCKIGLFTALYLIPATCVLACYCYEVVHRPQWEHTALHLPCGDADDEAQVGRPPCRLARSIPPVLLLMIKYFGLLVIGLTSSIWIWSAKTFNTWRRFLLQHVCRTSGMKRKTDQSQPMLAVARHTPLLQPTAETFPALPSAQHSAVPVGHRAGLVVLHSPYGAHHSLNLKHYPPVSVAHL